MFMYFISYFLDLQINLASTVWNIIPPGLILFVSSLILIFLTYKFIRPSQINIDVTKYNWRKVEDRGDPNLQLPPLYPNGWLPLLETKDLAVNQIKPIYAFEKDLIIYRGSSGKCYTFDAYCPHLGANIGVGGTVRGETVQCPFHAWVFNEDGKCIQIPGIDNVENVSATLNKYHTIEFNGFICVWHHSKEEEPYWLPEEKHKIDIHNLALRGRTLMFFNCHMQEMYENTADVQHIACLHLTPGLTGDLLKKSFLYYFFLKIMSMDWIVEWKAGTNKTKHTVDWLFETTPTIFGFKTWTFKSVGTLIGPALMINTVSMQITKNWTVEVNYINGIIQTAPLTHRHTFLWVSKPGFFNNIFAKYLQDENKGQTLRDAIMWTNKKFLKQPLLAKNEPFMVEYRRWYKQFYDE